MQRLPKVSLHSQGAFPPFIVLTSDLKAYAVTWQVALICGITTSPYKLNLEISLARVSPYSVLDEAAICASDDERHPGVGAHAQPLRRIPVARQDKGL